MVVRLVLSYLADAQMNEQIRELSLYARMRKVLRISPPSAHLRSVALRAPARACLKVRFRAFLKLFLHFYSLFHRISLIVKHVSKQTTLLRRTYSLHRACIGVFQSTLRGVERRVSRAICALEAAGIAAIVAVEGGG